MGKTLFSASQFSFKKIHLLGFLLIFYAFPAFALKIRFPDEELAKESVLPLIEPPRMVLNRRISLRRRFELGATLSIGLDEAFYRKFYGTGLLAFHLTEFHALSVTGTWFPPYRSKDGEALSGGRD